MPHAGSSNIKSIMKDKSAHPVARAHAKVAALCLALPGTTEEIKWDSRHFCVDGKIFVSFGAEDTVAIVSFKTTPEDQREKIRDPRYFIAPYVGRFGWVGLRLSGRVNWREVQAGIERSHALIAGGKAGRKKPLTNAPATRRISRA